MAILIIVAQLLIDSGTQSISDKYIQANDVLYEERVLDWGYAERSISVPVSLARIGDCRIRMADTDRRWRVLLESETPRRRRIRLVGIEDDVSPISENVIGIYEIVDFDFPQDIAEVAARDSTFAFFDKPVSQNLITRRNFPELAEGIDEAFMPIIAGQNRSIDDNPQGLFLLPHIGVSASPITDDRWGIAAHPIYVDIGDDVPKIYRKLPDEGLFTVVSDTEYTITTDALPRNIDGIDYFFTFLEFSTPQADGTQIRADVDGYYFRGVFENDDYSMPEVTSVDGPLRNPVDFLINVLYVVIKQDLQTSDFDIESFDRVRDYFEGTYASPADPHFCDGGIIEPITAGAFLQQFLTDFELDLFKNRFGKIELSLTYEENPDRPVFTDTLHFLKGSFKWNLAKPTFNRLRALFDLNYATKEYAGEYVFNNEADQLALAVPDSSPIIPHIEEQIVKFPFVRDEWTARRTIARRAAFLALGSYRCSFSVPLPETYQDLELSHQVGVTSIWGPGPNGWVNAEFKITDIVHRFGVRTTDVKAILREPQTVLPPEPEAAAGVFTAIIPIEMLTTQIFDDSMDIDYLSTSVTIDPEDYPGLTDAWFQTTVENFTQTTAKDFYVVDEDDNIRATVTVPAFSGNTRRRVAFDLDTTQARTYHIKLLAAGPSDTLDLSLYDAKILLEVEESERVKICVPMIAGDGSTGGGQATEAENDYWAWVSFRSNVAYGYGQAEFWHQIWLKEESKYSAVEEYELELTCAMNVSFGGTGYGALFNKTTNSMIAGTEISFTETAPTPKSIRFANSATNFTDMNEVEVRYKTVGINASIQFYRASLNIILSPATKGLIYHRVGNNTGGLSSSNTQQFPQWVRYLHEPSKYNTGALFYFEQTAYEQTGTAASCAMIDMGLSDQGGSAVEGHAGSASLISSGSGTWNNVPGLIGIADTGVAQFNSSTSLDEGIAEVGDFGMDGLIPGGSEIASVVAIIAYGVVGQSANIALNTNGGTYQNFNSNESSFVINGSPPPTHTVILRDHEYNLIALGAWTPGSFDDGAFLIRVKGVHPFNATATYWYWDSVKLRVGYGTDVVDSPLNFALLTRSRQRSIALTTLVDGNRYIPHYNSNATNLVRHANAFVIAEVDAG